MTLNELFTNLRAGVVETKDWYFVQDNKIYTIVLGQTCTTSAPVYLVRVFSNDVNVITSPLEVNHRTELNKGELHIVLGHFDNWKMIKKKKDNPYLLPDVATLTTVKDYFNGDFKTINVCNLIFHNKSNGVDYKVLKLKKSSYTLLNLSHHTLYSFDDEAVVKNVKNSYTFTYDQLRQLFINKDYHNWEVKNIIP